NVLATRGLDVLAAWSLNVLPAGRLNILAAWSLDILAAGRLNLLARADECARRLNLVLRTRSLNVVTRAGQRARHHYGALGARRRRRKRLLRRGELGRAILCPRIRGRGHHSGCNREHANSSSESARIHDASPCCELIAESLVGNSSTAHDRLGCDTRGRIAVA